MGYIPVYRHVIVARSANTCGCGHTATNLRISVQYFTNVRWQRSVKLKVRIYDRFDHYGLVMEASYTSRSKCMTHFFSIIPVREESVTDIILICVGPATLTMQMSHPPGLRILRLKQEFQWALSTRSVLPQSNARTPCRNVASLGI